MAFVASVRKPRGILNDLINDAKRLHRSLIGVIEFDPSEDVQDDAFLFRHGFGGFRSASLSTLEDDGYGNSNGSKNGGFVRIVSAASGPYQTIIFLKRPTATPEDIEFSDIFNQAILMHEMGHVDDFERGLNIRPEKPFDAFAAEYYAHRFACREMRRRELIVPLWLYLSSGTQALMESPIQSVRDAAIEFSNSPEYEKYRSFVGIDRLKRDNK